MPSPITKANLPIKPADGMEFVDFTGVKWVFSSASNCWMQEGLVQDVSDATEDESGLLNARLKTLLDSIPTSGGAFGIITRPLLSVVPLGRQSLLRGIVSNSIRTSSGSNIQVNSNDSGGMIDNGFAGKLMLFRNGLLNNQHYIIFGNDSDTFFLQGPDGSQAKVGDKFDVIDAGVLNEEGVIMGDVKLVSHSLDIECVDGNGDPFPAAKCNVTKVFADDPDNPPGLDLKLNQNFLDSFCVQIPGRKGPQGKKGATGSVGAPGTGDGPEGETGDAGLDATEVEEFTGIKINDIQDVFDTAVVALELDAVNGKLHVVKAKVKTPENDSVADQVIATAINRDIRFVDSDFGYELAMPNGDPIDVSDVEIIYYPKDFKLPNVDSPKALAEADVNIVKLSTFVNTVIELFEKRLDTASDKYDKEIKPYIEGKDEEARRILANLADELARCEWDLPVEFCIGIRPNDCSPENPHLDEGVPFPLAETLLGPEYENATAVPLPKVKVPGSGGGGGDPGVPTVSSPPGFGVPPTTEEVTQNAAYVEIDGLDSGTENTRADVTTPSTTVKYLRDADGGTTLRPGTYVVTYVDGAVRNASGSSIEEEAYVNTSPGWLSEVLIDFSDQNGNNGQVVVGEESDLAAINNFEHDAYTQAQRDSGAINTAAAFVLTAAGEAEIRAGGTGAVQEGDITVQPYFVALPGDSSAPVPITQFQQRDSQGNISDGGGGAAAAAGGDVSVDCGDLDVDCPPCECVTITSSNPHGAASGGGTTITITGTGFGVTQGTITVNGVSQTITAWTPTSITFTDTGGSTSSTGTIVVLTEGGDSADAPNAIHWV